MLNEMASYLNGKRAGICEYSEAEVGDSFLTTSANDLINVCEMLKNDKGFHVLQVITGTDFPDESQIEVTYVLANFKDNLELLLKVRLPRDNPEIESVVSLWKSANFQERECYDMLGVKFLNHPDLRRILCPDDWEGYPLRKDYVVQEKYRDMVVNPESKMNNADREFAQKQKDLLKKEKASQS